MKQLITLFLGLAMLSCGSSKTTSKTTTMSENENALPGTVFGEWFDPSGNSEYNGVLIHRNFIENGYTAFMYNKITKTSDNHYEFTGKNNRGDIIPFKLQVLNDNTITLQSGNYAKTTYLKYDHPKYGQPVSMANVPKAIKNTWFTTNGENTLDFDINDNQFKFKGEDYKVDEIMHIVEPHIEQYRFVVSNGNKSWMFYFKNWDIEHVQIGYNTQKGNLYKSNKSFSEPSNELPVMLFGEWHNPSENNQYDGVLIQPNFIEYMYTAYMFDSIDKVNDTDYQFTARSSNKSLTGTLSLLNNSTINLQIGDINNGTYIKKDLPLDGTPVSTTNIPDEVKGSWFPTQGSNTAEFEVTDSQFTFRGQDYKVDEIMLINDGVLEQYRFVVSNDKQTYMFYFKNWRNNLIQIGFDGMSGGIYQKN